MTRHAAFPASAAALVAFALVAGCSAAPAEPAAAPPSSSTRTVPPSLPPDQAEMWAEEVDSPKQTVPADDLCGLLTALEITAATGVQAVEGIATGPDKCTWPLGATTDAKGVPDSGLVIQTPKAVAWLGERIVLDGNPARRGGGGEVCMIKVLLREPVEVPDDRPALLAVLAVKQGPEDRCPALESLLLLALDRLPPA